MNIEKDYVFFGENGLTSTSANHIANLCKEMIKKAESVINNISFYTETVSLIGTSNQNLLKEGTKNIENLPEYLSEIAKAKSLIAWLREAIKAKERLSKYWDKNASEIYMKENNLEYPKYPESENSLTEDEYYSNLSIKERNRYYELETEAAVLGKYIHSDGEYAEERKALAYYIQNPNKVEGNGRDTLIYSYKPTIELSKVDEMFFDLQRKHREVQAQLNQIKYQCEQAVTTSKIEADEKYTKALSEYINQQKEIEANQSEFRTKKLKEVRDLKIIIPDSLKSIYEEVSKLGK